MLQLNDSLVLDFMQNSSVIRPFLCEKNRKQVESITVIKDDLEIKFNLDNLTDDVHGKAVGEGTLNSDSFLSSDKSSTDGYYSIDAGFLEAFFDDFNKHALVENNLTNEKHHHLKYCYSF